MGGGEGGDGGAPPPQTVTPEPASEAALTYQFWSFSHSVHTTILLLLEKVRYFSLTVSNFF